MVLAVRTVAMAAGMRHADLVVTRGALREHVGTGGGAALGHGGKCLAVGRQNRIGVLCEELAGEGFDDR